MKGELGMVPQALTAWRRYGRNVLRLLPVMALVTMFTGSLLDFHHRRGLDRRLMQPLENKASRMPTKKFLPSSLVRGLRPERVAPSGPPCSATQPTWRSWVVSDES